MAIKFTSDCEGTVHLSEASATGTTAALILVTADKGGSWSARVRVTADDGAVLTTRSLGYFWNASGALRSGIAWATRRGYTDLTAEQRGIPMHIYPADLRAAQA